VCVFFFSFVHSFRSESVWRGDRGRLSNVRSFVHSFIHHGRYRSYRNLLPARSRLSTLDALRRVVMQCNAMHRCSFTTTRINTHSHSVPFHITSLHISSHLIQYVPHRRSRPLPPSPFTPFPTQFILPKNLHVFMRLRIYGFTGTPPPPSRPPSLRISDSFLFYSIQSLRIHLHPPPPLSTQHPLKSSSQPPILVPNCHSRFLLPFLFIETFPFFFVISVPFRFFARRRTRRRRTPGWFFSFPLPPPLLPGTLSLFLFYSILTPPTTH
jgi:hypothetical protein